MQTGAQDALGAQWDTSVPGPPSRHPKPARTHLEHPSGAETRREWGCLSCPCPRSARVPGHPPGEPGEQGPQSSCCLSGLPASAAVWSCPQGPPVPPSPQGPPCAPQPPGAPLCPPVRSVCSPRDFPTLQSLLIAPKTAPLCATKQMKLTCTILHRRQMQHQKQDTGHVLF